MLSRTTLLACPACSRHVFSADSACPSCGAKLRGADGAVARTQVALAMGLGAVFSLAGVGCGDSEGSGGGGGGGGTTTSSTASSTTKSTSQASTTMAVSTYGVGPSSSSTGMPACDDGTPAPIDTIICEECFACAVAGACATEYGAYQADPEAADLDACLDGCQSLACTEDCLDMYPSAGPLYLDLLSCAVCQECPNNCDAATNCQ